MRVSACIECTSVPRKRVLNYVLAVCIKLCNSIGSSFLNGGDLAIKITCSGSVLVVFKPYIAQLINYNHVL